MKVGFQRRRIFGKMIPPKLENHIHILVPFFNAEQYISQCIDSILSQNYSKFTIYLFDDGSTDNSYKICKQYFKHYKNKIVLTKNLINNGPAYSKYNGMSLIKKYSSPNDIFVIIDGDDYLTDKEALNIINNKYLETKCWMTYGSCVGQWCEQAEDPPANDFRKHSWRYTHPRSFKCELISYFEEKDFKINGHWLLKGTDRPLIFNCLEWAGQDKIQYIKEPVYFYRTHSQNIIKILDPNSIIEHKNYVNNQTPKEQKTEPIDIVMCSWKRHHNLQIIINSLDEQTVSKNINLHIINNNIETKHLFTKLYSRNIKLNIAHNEYNGFGFERFLYTKNLKKQKLLDYIIFIDDDQIFYSDFIKKLYSLKQPKSMITWYGKIFDRQNINYWQIDSFKTRKTQKQFDYGGTGGCIIDCSVFDDDSMLFNINNIEKKYSIQQIEDLWLSYIISLYGYKIYNSFLPPIELTDKDTTNQALWIHIKEHKQNLLEYLILEKKWKLLADTTQLNLDNAY